MGIKNKQKQNKLTLPFPTSPGQGGVGVHQCPVRQLREAGLRSGLARKQQGSDEPPASRIHGGHPQRWRPAAVTTTWTCRLPKQHQGEHRQACSGEAGTEIGSRRHGQPQRSLGLPAPSTRWAVQPGPNVSAGETG